MRLPTASVFRLLWVSVLLLLPVAKSSAQGLIWYQWFVGNSTIKACAIDANNNGYFVGSFGGTVDFDPGLGVLNLTAGGDCDMFIMKKDAAGNLLWLKTVTEINSAYAHCTGVGVEVDGLGNVYIGGYFRDSFDFDPGPGVHILGTYFNGSYYSSHGFVLKLSPSGDFIWVKEIGVQPAYYSFSVHSIKIDTAANIFIACGFGSDTPCLLDVDPGPGVHNIQCQNGGNFLIEKLDSAGNFIWAESILGSGTPGEGPVISAMALDKLNNIYISGELRGTADFDPGPGVANHFGSIDVFAAKYDSAGNYQWTGVVTGGWHDYGHDIATDTFGNIVLTGEIDMGTVDFDPGPGVYNVTFANSHNMFILKLRSDGTFAWARSPVPSNYGYAITTDGLGNIFTAGDYNWNGVQKHDSAGNFVWGKHFWQNNWPSAITLDNAGDIYVAGASSGGGFIEKLCGASLEITTTHDTLCLDGTVVATLSAPYIPGAIYTWTWFGNVISGSSNTINVTHFGIYDVYIDGGSCPSAGQLYIYNCNGNVMLGVEETPTASTIQAYPNPFEDILTVKGLETNDRISLVDITGRVLYQWKATAPTQQFNTNELSPGYYILRVMNENGVVKGNVPVVKN